MLCELRQRLLALGYEFETVDKTPEETPDESETPEETPDETPDKSEEPEEAETPDESEEADEIKRPDENESLSENEKAALLLALRRSLVFVGQFCNRLDKAERWPQALREAALDLAAAYFLQAKMALRPESLAVLPTLTSLRMGNAAWGFGGGTQKSGTDALTRMEVLADSLLREAKAALCAWRSL